MLQYRWQPEYKIKDPEALEARAKKFLRLETWIFSRSGCS